MANRYFINIGANWGDTANWSDTSGGTGGFSVPTNADDVFFDANSGNCTVNASNRTAKTLNFTGYTNTITMTFIISISGSLTLAAGMGIAGASRIQLLATGTITTNGKTWPNNILTANTITLTLADDFNITGQLIIQGQTTINGTFNINVSGGVDLQSSIIKGTGTPKLYFKGGTVASTTTSNRIRLDSYIDGNITIGEILVIADNGSINYVSGTVTNTPNNTLTFANLNVSIDLGAIQVNNVTFSSATFNYTITLLSDLNINGLFTATGGTVNGSYNINCKGGILNNLGGFLVAGTGTPNINLLGGNWTSNAVAEQRINTNINGNISITGTIYFNTGTLTYLSGIVNAKTATLNIGTSVANSTFINCDKINFKTIIITENTTQTFNRFFSGSAITPTRIQSRIASNYTISFQDGFEKITKFTKISNCTVTNRGQLLCLTPNSNKGGNVGVRYINQMPDGFAKNSPSIPNTMTNYIASISDPTFQTIL